MNPFFSNFSNQDANNLKKVLKSLKSDDFLVFSTQIRQKGHRHPGPDLRGGGCLAKYCKFTKFDMSQEGFKTDKNSALLRENEVTGRSRNVTNETKNSRQSFKEFV